MEDGCYWSVNGVLIKRRVEYQCGNEIFRLKTVVVVVVVVVVAGGLPRRNGFDPKCGVRFGIELWDFGSSEFREGGVKAKECHSRVKVFVPESKQGKLLVPG